MKKDMNQQLAPDFELAPNSYEQSPTSLRKLYESQIKEKNKNEGSSAKGKETRGEVKP
jgi:hypothetical protein